MKTVILIPGQRTSFDNYRLAVEAAGGWAVFTETAERLPAFAGLLLPGGGRTLACFGRVIMHSLPLPGKA